MWKHQKKCINDIQNYFTDENNTRCLINSFCGTGKSSIEIKTALSWCKQRAIFVFPTISLTEQFSYEYINKCEEAKQMTKFAVCSQTETPNAKLKFTTDKNVIIFKLNKKNKQLIAVTYASLPNLLSIIYEQEMTIDIMIFDEAHHIRGNNILKCLQDNDFSKYVSKTIYFTATPQDLYENKITKAICGPIIFNYSHHEAVEDKVCNDFDICLDIFTPKEKGAQKYLNYLKTLDDLNEINCDDDDLAVFKEERKILSYEAVSRAMLKTSNMRSLTFHHQSETEHKDKSHVSDFVKNPGIFRQHFEKVRTSEFPDTNKPKKITLKGITQKTKGRIELLNQFDQTSDDDVYVLASCKTIGEGIDTKNGNLLMFVDAKTSVTTILQNIGRVTRKNDRTKRKSTILIPCYVNLELYQNCKTEDEKHTVLINEICRFGSFETVLNVLTALKQNDPEYFNLCINYPNKYSPKEVKANLEKQDCKIGEEFTREGLAELYEVENDDDMFSTIAKENDCSVEVYGQSMEEPVATYNEEADESLRFFHNDETEGYNIVEGGKKKIEGVKRKKFKLNINASDDFKVLWNLEENSFDDLITKAVTTAYIQSTVIIGGEENQMKKAVELVKWVRENNKMPSSRTGNDEEKSLAYFINNMKQGLKGNGRRILYSSVKEYLDKEIPDWRKGIQEKENYEENALQNAKNLVRWIKEHNNKIPVTTSDNVEEKKLAYFLGDMKKTSKGIGNRILYSSVENYLNKEIPDWRKEKNNKEIALQNAKNLVMWIKEHNNKMPNARSEDKEEKKLGVFLNNNKRAGKANVTTILYPCVKKYLDKKIPGWNKSRLLVVKSIPKESESTSKENHELPKLSQLHKEYKHIHSTKFHSLMIKTPSLFSEYHDLAHKNDQQWEESVRPVNFIALQLKEMFKTIIKLEKVKIIDLGSGPFYFAEALFDAFKTKSNHLRLQQILDTNYMGVDVIDSREQSEEQNERIQNLPFISSDIASLDDVDEDTFDIALLCRSLWATNKQDVLKEARRIVKNGGKLFVCEPFQRWYDEKTKKLTIFTELEKAGWKIDAKFNTKLDEDGKYNTFFYVVCRKDDMSL